MQQNWGTHRDEYEKANQFKITDQVAEMNIPENERWIVVPKNEDGEHDCDYGDFESDNVLIFPVSEKEFRALSRNGAIDRMNMECDLLIQDYESEIIPAEKIASCMDIIREHGEFVNGAFMNAFEHVVDCGTFAQLEF